MNMFRKSAFAATMTLGLSLSPIANAAPTLSINIFDGATLIGSAMNVAGGFASATANDANFGVVQASVTGAPLLTSPDMANQSLQVTTGNGFTNPTTLHVMITQQGLTGFPAGNLANTFTGNTLASLGNYSSFTVRNYYDVTNAAFGTGTLMASASYSGVGSFSTGPTVFSATPGALFSETTVYSITFTGPASSVSGSAQIVAVPEPTAMTLFGAGLLGLGIARRARNRKQA